MSEREISSLLDAGPDNRTWSLIRLFDATIDEEGKKRVLHHLYDIGDEEITENFFSDLLQRRELAPDLKSWLTPWRRLHKDRTKQRLRAQLHGWPWPPEKVETSNKPKKTAKLLAFQRPTDK